MISIKPDTKITVLMPHQNKALDIALSLASPAQLEQLKEGKDLKSVVTSLFQSKLTNAKSDQVLLDILKTNTLFKQFGNFTQELKNLVTALKTTPNLTPQIAQLENSLKSMETLDLPTLKGQVANSGIFMESKIASATAPLKVLRETLQTLQNALTQTNQSEAKNLGLDLNEFMQHPLFEKASEDINAARTLIKTLQTLTNALERILPKIDPVTANEIKALEHLHTSHKELTTITKPQQLLTQNQLDQLLEHDVKSQLMKLSDEFKTLSTPVSNEVQSKLDQLITNIDYNQLVSHLEGSNTLYFPFSWDALEEGSLSFKKREEKKFYCEINLTLKEYGKIDLLMALYEGNQIEIQAYTENTIFKNLIQEHLPTLRALLTQAGVNARTIRIYDSKEFTTPSKTAYTPDETDFNAGFEVTV
jgi:hypothetical protein